MPTWVKDVVGIGLILMAAWEILTIIQLWNNLDWNNATKLLPVATLGIVVVVTILMVVLVLLGILPMNN